MNRFLVVIFLGFVCQFNGFSQEKINDYKYIVIPMEYEFQKSEDQYQLNSLTKFLFNKYGYIAFLENEELPDDLVKNRCLGLNAIVKKIRGGFLLTKVQIDLIDCKKQVIASSVIGKSKEKAHKTAYNNAIREAFTTFQYMGYNYAPNPSIIDEQTAQEKEIERLKKEVETLKETDNSNPVESTENEEPKPEISSVSETEVAIPRDPIVTEKQKNLLYAQPIQGGFQVVDTEPKKVMVLLHSGAGGYFIVQGRDAVVYKKGLVWIYAENDGKNVTTKEIELKF